MKEIATPKIAGIPDGRVVLRWFGRIIIDDGKNREPALETVFYKKDRYSSATISRPIGIQFIPLLKIGSVWEDERCVDYESYMEKSLAIRVKENCRIIDAGHTIQNEYLIPPSKYRIGQDWLGSKCALIESNECSLIIPCAEIMRFYYGHSSTLMKLIFSGRFSKKMICHCNMSRIVGQNAYLQLKSNIPDSLAPTIGRFVFDEYAMTCAQNIHKSIVKNKMLHDQTWVEAWPPLQGETTIQVQGIEMERDLFLVLRILSCSHKFPFDNLFFTKNTANERESENATQEDVKFNNRYEHNDRGYASEYDAKTRTIVYKDTSVRFSALDSVTVKKATIDEYIPIAGRIKSAKSPDTTKSDKDTPEKVEIEPISLKRSQAIPASLRSFFQIVEHISLDRNITCEYLRINPVDGDESLSSFPIVRGRSRVLKWSFIGNLISRKCIIVRIEYHGRNYYAFEAEQSPGKEFHTILVVNNTDKTELDDYQVGKVLEVCVKNRGRWLKQDQMTELERKKLKHTSKSVSRYANRLKALIKKKGEEPSGQFGLPFSSD